MALGPASSDVSANECRSGLRLVEESAHAEDVELAARIRSGDERAFEELVRAHYAAMCSAAIAVLRSREAVEDIVQNVFRKLWTHRARWQPRGPIRAYLLLASRNEALSVVRALRRERGLAGHILERMPREHRAGESVPGMGAIPLAIDDDIAAAELRSAIETAAAALSTRCRTVFLLRWKDGFRQTEIAEHLGISIKTVEMQMTRALKTIRARLAEIGLP